MTGESNNNARLSTLDTGQSQTDSHDGDEGSKETPEPTMASAPEPDPPVATRATTREIPVMPDARSAIATVPKANMRVAAIPDARRQQPQPGCIPPNYGNARPSEAFHVANYTVYNTYNNCNVVVNNGLSRENMPRGINRDLIQGQIDRDNIEREARRQRAQAESKNTIDANAVKVATDTIKEPENTTATGSQEETPTDIPSGTIEQENEPSAEIMPKEIVETERNMENLLSIAAKATDDSDGELPENSDTQATPAGVAMATDDDVLLQNKSHATQATPDGEAEVNMDTAGVPKATSMAITQALPVGIAKATYDADDVPMKNAINATQATPAGVVKATYDTDDVPMKKAFDTTHATPALVADATDDADDVPMKKAIDATQAAPVGVAEATDGAGDTINDKETTEPNESTPGNDASQLTPKNTPKKVRSEKKVRSSCDISPDRRGARHRSKAPERRPVVKSPKDRKLRISQSSRIANTAKRDDRNNGSPRNGTRSRIPRPVKKSEPEKVIAEMTKTIKANTLNAVQKKAAVKRRDWRRMAPEKVAPDSKQKTVAKAVTKPPRKPPAPRMKVIPEPGKLTTGKQPVQKTSILEKKEIQKTTQTPVIKAPPKKEAKPPPKPVMQKKKNVPPDKKTPSCGITDTTNKRKKEEECVTQFLRETIRNLKPKQQISNGDSARDVKMTATICSPKNTTPRVHSGRKVKKNTTARSSKTTTPSINSTMDAKETATAKTGMKANGGNAHGKTSTGKFKSGIPIRSKTNLKKGRDIQNPDGCPGMEEHKAAPREQKHEIKSSKIRAAAITENNPENIPRPRHVVEEQHYSNVILKFKEVNSINQMLEVAMVELDLMVFEMTERACERNINNAVLDKLLGTMLRAYNNEVAKLVATQVILYPEKFNLNNLNPGINDVFSISPPLPRLIEGTMPGIHIKYPHNANEPRVQTPFSPQEQHSEKSYDHKNSKMPLEIVGDERINKEVSIFNTVKSFVAEKLRIENKSLTDDNHDTDYLITGNNAVTPYALETKHGSEQTADTALDEMKEIRDKAGAFDIMFTLRNATKPKPKMKPIMKDGKKITNTNDGVNSTPRRPNDAMSGKGKQVTNVTIQKKAKKSCIPRAIGQEKYVKSNKHVEPSTPREQGRTLLPPVRIGRSGTAAAVTDSRKHVSKAEFDTIRSADRNVKANNKVASGRQSRRVIAENKEKDRALQSKKTHRSSTPNMKKISLTAAVTNKTTSRTERPHLPPITAGRSSASSDGMRTPLPPIDTKVSLTAKLPGTPKAAVTHRNMASPPLSTLCTPLPPIMANGSASQVDIRRTPLPPIMANGSTSPLNVRGTPLPPITCSRSVPSFECLRGTPLPLIRSFRSTSQPADIPTIIEYALRINVHGTPSLDTSRSSQNLSCHRFAGRSNKIRTEEASVTMMLEPLSPLAMIETQFRMSADGFDGDTIIDMDTYRSDDCGRVSDGDDMKADILNSAVKSHRSQA